LADDYAARRCWSSNVNRQSSIVNPMLRCVVGHFEGNIAAAAEQAAEKVSSAAPFHLSG
jgi:hypothetical protein